MIDKWHLGGWWPSNQSDGYMNGITPIGEYCFKGRNRLRKNIAFKIARRAFFRNSDGIDILLAERAT